MACSDFNREHASDAKLISTAFSIGANCPLTSFVPGEAVILRRGVMSYAIGGTWGRNAVRRARHDDCQPAGTSSRRVFGQR